MKKEKDRVTSETIFMYGIIDKDNALADSTLNCIIIGKDTLTLETLIHELNEIQIMQILKNLGYENKTIINKCYVKPVAVSHLLSPYGEKSLIYPYSKKRKEEKLNE
jgi:hypothetical protein